MKTNARIDARSEALVQDVQSYSNPTGRSPSPPADASPEPHSFAEPELPRQTGPDRLATPEWFVPRADSLVSSADNTDNVPAVSDDVRIPDVSPAEEQIISTTGVEALAYYAPFHFYQRHQWGIYIRDFGLAYLATRFLGRHTINAADNWVLRCAYEFLLQHEYSHFQAEVAVSRYELLLFQKTIYLDHVYLHHFSDRHSSWLEESVANARAYQRFEHKIQTIASQSAIDQFKSFLANWMKCQPSGYRDYDRWIGRAGLKKGRSAIAMHLHESVQHWRRGAIKNDGDIFDLFRDAEYSKIPITRVPDARLTALRSARQLPKAYGLQVSVFSNDHPPPHIHVDFLDGKTTIRVEWPSLQPLRHDRPLSHSERSNLGANCVWESDATARNCITLMALPTRSIARKSGAPAASRKILDRRTFGDSGAG
jgi:hypothetical protein